MMKDLLKMTSIAIAVGAQLVCTPALSSIPRTARTIDFSAAKEVDFASVKPVESLRTIKSEDVAMIIPADMKETNRGGRVAVQILDHSLESFFKSKEIKNSALGRTAHQLDSVIEGDMAIGGAKEGETKHVFKFKMKAIQSKALIDYSGFVNAQLSYSIGQEKLNLDITEKVAQNTNLVLSHSDKKGDRTQMVSLRLDF